MVFSGDRLVLAFWHLVFIGGVGVGYETAGTWHWYWCMASTQSAECESWMCTCNTHMSRKDWSFFIAHQRLSLRLEGVLPMSCLVCCLHGAGLKAASLEGTNGSGTWDLEYNFHPWALFGSFLFLLFVLLVGWDGSLDQHGQRRYQCVFQWRPTWHVVSGWTICFGLLGHYEHARCARGAG